MEGGALMAEESRLCDADYQRLMRGIKSAIKEEVPQIVRAELDGIGLLTADPKDKIETIQAIAFLKSLLRGSHAAQGIVGKRVVSGILWMIGVALMLGAGALLEKTFGK
jgi:hypothetical protein